MRKTGGSQSTFSSIERPIRSAAYAQLERQTLALCAFGVQPKMRPCVYDCRQPKAERYITLISAGGRLWRGRADSREGVGARSGKVAHSTKDGNPLGWHAPSTRTGRSRRACVHVWLNRSPVCLFYYCRTYYKAVRVGGGGGRRVEVMCYERRRAEACVDESAHHALGPGLFL